MSLFESLNTLPASSSPNMIVLGGALQNKSNYVFTVNVLSYLTRQSTARKWIIEFEEIWTFTEKDVSSE